MTLAGEDQVIAPVQSTNILNQVTVNKLQCYDTLWVAATRISSSNDTRPRSYAARWYDPTKSHAASTTLHLSS